MPRISAAFFAFGVLSVLAGMLLGMQMGATENMTLTQTHAHINLVGWVTMALYGTFYAFTRETKSLWLARLNFLVSAAGVIVMIGFLTVFLLNGNDPKWIPGMVAGEVLTLVGLLIFAISVLRELFRKRHGTLHEHP